MKIGKLILGILLMTFNICVFIFAQSEISPEYFEPLFGFYAAIAWILGINWIYRGITEKTANGK